MNSTKMLRSVVLSVSLLLLGFSSEGQSQNMRFNQVLNLEHFSAPQASSVSFTVPANKLWKVVGLTFNEYNDYNVWDFYLNGFLFQETQWMGNSHSLYGGVREVWLTTGDNLSISIAGGYTNKFVRLSVIEYELY